MPREAKSPPARSITFEDFTEVTFQAVLRALEARKLPRGPIIIGIIWAPEGLRGLTSMGTTSEER